MYLGIEPTRKNIKLVLKNRHLPRELIESPEVREILDYTAHLPESMVGKPHYSKPIALEPDETVR